MWNLSKYLVTPLIYLTFYLIISITHHDNLFQNSFTPLLPYSSLDLRPSLHTYDIFEEILRQESASESKIPTPYSCTTNAFPASCAKLFFFEHYVATKYPISYGCHFTLTILDYTKFVKYDIWIGHISIIWLFILLLTRLFLK